MTGRTRLLGWLGVGALGLASCGGGSNGPNPTTDASMVRVCLRMAACGLHVYPRVADCIKYLPTSRSLETDIYRCIDGSTTCAATNACYGTLGECDRSFQARCEDGNAVTCDLIDKRAYTFHCSQGGTTCTIDPAFPFTASCQGAGRPGQPLDTAVNCAGELCVKTGVTCGQTESPNDRCSGDQAESCLEGEWVRFDCSRLGLGTCRTQGDTPSTTWGHCGKPPG